ncbi:hypothetical protein O6P43_031515 [Quillaja saponaria]|uniref:Uncharacterized protein n=1 Tax=Quillaja saponaria TaxID=32244 RepID=A0AAD7KVF9_QUISA|nr:hypothetical protein O6P43_031515 [Quillaja saponaria]
MGDPPRRHWIWMASLEFQRLHLLKKLPLYEGIRVDSDTDIPSPIASPSGNMSKRCTSETEITEPLASPSRHMD